MKHTLLFVLGLLFSLTSKNNVEAQLPVRKMPVSQSLQVGVLVGDRARDIEQAKSFLFTQNYFQAIDETDNIIAADPNHVEAYLLRGYIKELVGMKAAAKQDFEKAQSLNPYALQIMGYQGKAGKLEAMTIDPSASLKELPYEVKYNYYLSYLDDKFSQKMGNENSEELEKRYDKEWTGLQKSIQFSEKKDYENAIAEIDKLLEEYPQSSLGLDMKGLLLIKSSRFSEAEQYLQKALGINPKLAIAWYNLSVVKRMQNQPELSLSHLNRALSLQANLSKAYFDRALVKEQLGDEKGALKDYNILIEDRNGKYLEAFLNRGLTFKMLGDFESALKDINFVIENSKPSSDLFKNRGNLFALMGEMDAAVEDYKRAIDLNPSYSEAFFNRGIAYLNLGKDSKACADFEESKILGYETADEKLRYFCK